MSHPPILEHAGDDPIAIAACWLLEGRQVTLATVVKTWGSAPRPVGSHLVIDRDGNFAGSVSGGCVENDVIAAATEEPYAVGARLLEFGIGNDVAWRAGLSCGGEILILVSPLNQADVSTLIALWEAKQARMPVVHAISLAGAASLCLSTLDDVDRDLGTAASTALSAGHGMVFETGTHRWFLNVHPPQTRILIIGAVHIAQILSPMATRAGFAVAVVDPRAAYATADRFPDSTLLAQWPEDALKTYRLDEHTAVVAITHEPNIDDIPIIRALEAGCFYVGALGSSATHRRRLDRLATMGISPDLLQEIHGPIGLDIGARSPAEIAVSILAEIVSEQRGRKAMRSVR